MCEQVDNREWWGWRTSEKEGLGDAGRRKKAERLSKFVSVYSTPHPFPCVEEIENALASHMEGREASKQQ